MVRTIKIHIIALDKIEVREVGLEEAKAVVQGAYEQGNLVIDKDTEDMIDEITPNTKELLVVEVLGGG